MSNLVFVVLEMTEEEPDRPRGKGGKVWLHVEKAWMIGIAGGLIVQIFAGVWWASSQTAQLNEISLRFHALEAQLAIAGSEQVIRSEKVARSEVRMENLIEANKELDKHLSVIEGWLYSTS